ncbi:kinase-like domain-containing protein [Lipomyces kononenkoae]|uniref:Kinase-like domain-containing protein n=1 Tax=Lipomyces kononenkoae TaxID=34357 RepID=A0ACC3T2V5_LIPKO
MSTGLLSKKNRPSNGLSEASHFAPPDTPCKRPAQPQFSAASPSFKSSKSNFSESSHDAEEIFDLAGRNGEYEMPPTPTKTFGSAHGETLHSPTVSQAWNIPTTKPVDSQFPTVSPVAGSLSDLKTPTTPAKPAIGYYDPLLTPSSNLDTLLLNKFQDVSSIGAGEFSTVYLVTEREKPHNKYAVKRTKTPLAGQKSLVRRLEEVAILKDLSSRTQDDDREYIINFIDSWEFQGHLYIMTEYCENGNLDVFLAEYGSLSKLDEWRVWKILVEIAFGLRFIHDAGYIHLDLKPANVFITFEGSLKIGDFGMAAKLPVTKGIEREGDREYIAPEVLALQEYSKPADIFSFGLVMLEIAANIVLPDNGAPWHKLRSGDLSDAGRLSSSSGDLKNMNKADGTRIPPWAPDFMLDEAGSLDKFVKWMLKPTPIDRPTIHNILQTEEVRTVESRRRSGAIIFEGEYGPEPITDLHKTGKDMSMLDQDEDWRMEL